MAIAPIIAIGIAAVGTAASIASQQAAARRQEQQLELGAADAEQRIELAKDEFKFVKEQAKRTRASELALADEQAKLGNLNLQQQAISQAIARVQTKVQAADIRGKAREYATQLLTQATQEKAGVNEQGLQRLQGAAGLELNVPTSKSRAYQNMLDERTLNAMEGARGQALQENQAAEGIADQNYSTAENLGNIQKQIANLAAGSSERLAKLETQTMNKQMPIAKKLIQLQKQRNKKAVQTKYFATASTANMAALSQVAQEQAYLRQNELQKSQIQKPGFFTYANALAGLASNAMQSGLLTFGSRTGGSVNGLLPPVGTGQPYASTINQPPPGYANTPTQSPLLDMIGN